MSTTAIDLVRAAAGMRGQALWRSVLAQLCAATGSARAALYLPDGDVLVPVVARGFALGDLVPASTAAVADGRLVALRDGDRLGGAVRLEGGGPLPADLTASAAAFLLADRASRDVLEPLRDPLTCVHGFALLLRADPDGLSAEQREWAAMIGASAERMLDTLAAVEQQHLPAL